jgi:hypothetical protein
MLDSDLARIYGIDTKVLNQAVKRNIHKFPPEFRFQLTRAEYENLRCQIGTSRWECPENQPNLRSQIVTSSYGGRRYLPFVFTEHGVVMLASVLNSKTAVQVNIAVVKAFVAMRHYVEQPVKKKLDDLEKILMLHIDDTNGHLSEHAAKINEIITALGAMVEKPKPKRRIGFNVK